MTYKNIAVNADVHQRAKLRATEIGLPLGRVVDRLLELWLDNRLDLEEDTDDARDADKHRGTAAAD